MFSNGTETLFEGYFREGTDVFQVVFFASSRNENGCSDIILWKQGTVDSCSISAG